MYSYDDGYVNGYLERTAGGAYVGRLTIDGVDISPIVGVYFKSDDGVMWLWLKRRTILEFDDESQSYKSREARPRWEVYMRKVGDGSVAYRGVFGFMRFRYSITGVWDKVLGKDERYRRLNFFVERLPMAEQTVVNGIRMRKGAFDDRD